MYNLRVVWSTFHLPTISLRSGFSPSISSCSIFWSILVSFCTNRRVFFLHFQICLLLPNPLDIRILTSFLSRYSINQLSDRQQTTNLSAIRKKKQHSLIIGVFGKQVGVGLDEGKLLIARKPLLHLCQLELQSLQI